MTTPRAEIWSRVYAAVLGAFVAHRVVLSYEVARDRAENEANEACRRAGL